VDDGDTVYGLRRDPTALPPGVAPVAADLTDRGSLEGVPADADAVVYAASADARDESAYRAAYVDGLHHLLWSLEERGGRPHRLLYSSSTGVYGQDDGEWVDERSPTEPRRFNGEILLQAERLTREAGGVVVRFSGIYGPGRDALIRKLREGGVGCRREPPVWTNRIHAEDCAAALAHLVGMTAPEAVYVASDRCPAPRWDVLEWLAGRLGVDGPEEIDDQRGQGKRVRAERLFAGGVALQYPDYRAGYSEMLECE